MRLRLKYFMLMYITFIEFLERNVLKSAFRKAVGCHSILWYLRDEKLLNFMPDNVCNLDYTKRWYYICRTEKDCKIYYFIQFLGSLDIYSKFRALHTNLSERNIEEYLLENDPRDYILVLLRLTKDDEYRFWIRYHSMWVSELKKLSLL